MKPGGIDKFCGHAILSPRFQLFEMALRERGGLTPVVSRAAGSEVSAPRIP